MIESAIVSGIGARLMAAVHCCLVEISCR